MAQSNAHQPQRPSTRQRQPWRERQLKALAGDADVLREQDPFEVQGWKGPGVSFLG